MARSFFAIPAPKPGPLVRDRRLLVGVQQKWKETQTKPTGLNAKGVLGPFRISRVARYTKAFKPAREFQPDADTIALFSLSTPSTTELIGDSIHKVHAVIHNANWIVQDDKKE